MTRLSVWVRAVLLVGGGGGIAAPIVIAQLQPTGILLEDLTWVEARDRLLRDTIVVIPLGAQSKEHGPHLRLSTDWLTAEYYKRRVLERADVVVAPTVNYSFYPAFVDYPGSTSLSHETARDLIVQICRTLAAAGPRRFYILNTGVSTMAPLAAAQALLAADGIVLRSTDILKAGASAVDAVSEQPEGTHADEIETSMMLYIAPASVDMSRATKDFPVGTGPLTPFKGRAGRYSPSGIYGDATLATRAKGEKVVEATLADILLEIESLRRIPVP